MITVILYLHNVTNSQHSSFKSLFYEKYMMACKKPTETIKPTIYAVLAMLVRCWFTSANMANNSTKALGAFLLAVGSKNDNSVHEG